jgi:hypothetical protein
LRYEVGTTVREGGEHDGRVMPSERIWHTNSKLFLWASLQKWSAVRRHFLSTSRSIKQSSLICILLMIIDESPGVLEIR